jgi:hypothetical protein
MFKYTFIVVFYRMVNFKCLFVCLPPLRERKFLAACDLSSLRTNIQRRIPLRNANITISIASHSRFGLGLLMDLPGAKLPDSPGLASLGPSYVLATSQGTKDKIKPKKFPFETLTLQCLKQAIFEFRAQPSNGPPRLVPLCSGLRMSGYPP